ncbi:MAG: hypothetical protein D6722_15050 [Bacteroidetes bacterium]|nr:MAG: hypothetical protein D6722_15050 [Bacteroidota bacterium]
MRKSRQAKLLIGLSMGWLLACGSPADEHATQTARLLSALRAEAVSERDSARQVWPDYFFTAADVPLVQAALAESYPDDSLRGGDTRRALLEVLAEFPAEIEAGPLAQVFAATDSLPRVRGRLLALLAETGQAQTLASLLPLAADDARIDWAEALTPVPAQPEVLAALLPQTKSLLKQPHLAPLWVLILAEGLDRGHLAPADLTPLADPLLTYGAQIPAGQAEAQAGFLRLTAHLGRDPRFNQVLGQALAGGERQLPAIAACLEVGIPVADSLIEGLAARAETRLPLYLLLQQQGQSHRFPPDFLGPVPMAAADLALWLARRGHEAGAPEWLATFPLQEQGLLMAFRFRQRGRWLLGLSGPQPADSSRFETGGYLTGSLMQPYRAYRLRRDVESYLEQLDAGYLLAD